MKNETQKLNGKITKFSKMDYLRSPFRSCKVVQFDCPSPAALNKKFKQLGEKNYAIPTKT